MSEVQPSRLSVEFDPHADPITGQVYANGAGRLPFVGWLGLISALERIIAADQPAPSHTTAIAPATRAKSPTNHQGEPWLNG